MADFVIQPDKNIVEMSCSEFAEKAMKAYIAETVTNRSVPSFQDGLKPVQRKILWAMYKMGLFYNLSHKKSAKVTGEVIARYHPHGDCLDGETKIYAAGGNIYKIKDLIGKELEVWCWDKERNSLVTQVAKNFRTVKKDNLYTIHLSNGGKIRASGNHPILMENGEYKKVEDLQINDCIFGGFIDQQSGETIFSNDGLSIDKIEKETGDFLLYDFTVPVFENMMIKTSENSFAIVHNSAVYQAMGNMAQAFQKYNFIDGQGNWGAWSGESPAASRYTECRLTEIAQVCLLDKDYLKVVPMVDNYDGTEKEPAYLPARLPFILLLNIQGIATAVRTGLPSFDLNALVDFCIDFLKTKELDQTKVIPLTTINNGKCISTNEEQLNFYKSGGGVLTFSPTYLLGKDRIIITGVQDDFNFERISDDLLEMQEVKAVKDEGSKEIKVTIYFNGKLDQKQVDKILNKLKTKTLYSTNILKNTVDEEGVVVGKYHETNIYSLIKNWCKFRVGLEKNYLTNKIEEIDKELAYQNILLLASSNLKVIFKSLQTTDPKTYLLENLTGLKESDVGIILDLPIKRLSRLSEEETKKKISTLENDKAILNKKLEKPHLEVIKDLELLKKKFGN